MTNPELILDGDGDVWVLDADSATNNPIYKNSIYGYESLANLIKHYSPVHVLTKGNKLEPPFNPIAEGTWVEFDRGILPATVSGRVRYYDNDKLFYEISINVPRSSVKETL